MDVKWNGLLVNTISCLLVLCVFGFVSSQDDFVTECTVGCKIRNDAIDGEEGKDIQLRFSYVGKKRVVSSKLKFGNKTLLIAHLIPDKKVYKEADVDSRFIIPKYIDVQGTKSVLTVTLKNLSLLKDNGKVFEYIIYVFIGSKTVKINGSKVLNVFTNPTPCGAVTLKSNYTAEDDVIKTINLTLCANPPASVTARIGVKEFPVVRTATDLYQYMYTVSLRGTRKECGRNMEIQVVGHSNSTLSTKIIVLFTPNKVENISAALDYNNCMSVTWAQIDSGNCEVSYELQYVKNGTVRNILLKSTKWETCNSSINDTVNVRGLVNKRYGSFNSKSVTPSMPPPTPGTTKVLITTSGAVTVTGAKSKSDSPMQWKYILAIVVGVIALLLIIAVVVIAARRKGKSQGDNNNSQLEVLRPNQEVESDYAEVNSLRSIPVSKGPPDENQMVYAELGPGGGRTGPKPVPEESNYAKVKTEGLYYPPLQQSYREPPKQYPREPPRYSVASRGKKDSLRQSLTIDDDDDYVPDIIV